MIWVAVPIFPAGKWREILSPSTLRSRGYGFDIGFWRWPPDSFQRSGS